MIEAHDKSIEELYKTLNISKDGLSSSEAEQRLETYGKNELATSKKVNPFIIFFNQFRDLLVIILIVAGVITAVLGIIERDESIIIEVIAITIVVFLNAGLGFYQEFSAEKAIEALQSLATSEIIVLRDNEKKKNESIISSTG